VTPDVRQQVASKDYAILVKGVDDTKNWTYIAPPLRPFDEESLVRYDEVLADQSVALAQNAKAALSTQ
jgi:hypothetical protein